MPSPSPRLPLLCILSTLLWSTGSSIDCDSRTTCRECINMDSLCGWCADEGVRIDNRCRMNGMHTNCDFVFSPVSEVDDQQEEVFDRLRNITTNVTVGVGSYIDKAVLPFTRVVLSNPDICPEGITCYNFRHYGSMTGDRVELRTRFERVQTGSNIDAPEAGLDAMAQAALCRDEVGWRDSAVKMILYFTDDAFKFAGEGRHAGIVKPFEEVCGLEVDPTTTNYTIYEGKENDYASLGQLLHIFERENIIPVFIAVTSTTQAVAFYSAVLTHQAVAELFNIRLNGRASAAEVDTSGSTEEIASNILQIIDEQVLLVLMQTGLVPHTEGLEGISFSVEAECPPGAVEVNSGTAMESCSKVEVGNTTNFILRVTLEDCEKFGSEPRNISVQVFPLGEVTIQVTPICTCLCSDNEVNSERCSFNGNFSCGECTCEPGYCGLQCQIREDEPVECPSGIGGEECSGVRGSCLTCECLCVEDLRSVVMNDPRVNYAGVNTSAFGEACECDYFSCLPFSNNSGIEICSGRGDCCDSRCRCHVNENGYRYRSDGDDLRDCSCEPAEDVCRAANSTELCAGVGRCDCERCNCPVPYVGRFCEDLGLEECFDIATEPEIERCILDEKSRAEENSQCQTCSFSVINVVNISCVLIIPENEQPRSSDQDVVERRIEEFAAEELAGNRYQFLKMCNFNDNDSCSHDYYVVYNKDDISELVFIAEEQRTCISTTSSILDNLGIPLWLLAIILLGVLLILGILILAIIKAIFLLLDYFEVKRLEKEVGMADFSKNQNPLYQSPDVEYKNVAYGKE